MKVENKFKKLGIASLVAVGSVALPTSSHAVDLGDDGSSITAADLGDSFQNSVLNVTPGDNFEIRDANGNTKKILTTTSLYYKFGPAFESYEPIFHISPLSISVGCGGFSIKGMFMSILGIDRIQEMLKSSATSFAYGIVVGLIYTMPGIFHSFQMLNQWAKKIQELMNNACEGGKKIGKAIGDHLGMQSMTNVVNDFIDKIPSPEGVIGSMDSIADSFISALGLKTDDINSNKDKKVIENPTEINEATPEDLEEMLGKIMNQVRVYNSLSTSVMYNIMISAKNYTALDTFFCSIVDDTAPACKVISDYSQNPDGASLSTGFFALTYSYDGAGGVFRTFENNANFGNFTKTSSGLDRTFSLNTFLKDKLNYNSDVVVSKFMLLMKLAIQKATLGDVVLNEKSTLKPTMDIVRTIVKARKNRLEGNTSNDGFASAKEKANAAREVKEILNGEASFSIIGPSTQINEPEIIGRGLAQLLIGDKSAGKKAINSLVRQVPPLGYRSVVWPQDPIAHDTVSVSIFSLPASTIENLTGLHSFFQQVSLPDKSLFEASLNIAWRLIDRSNTETTEQIIDEESKDLGSGNGKVGSIPWIVPKFYIYAKIAQQSLPGDKEIAIKKLAQYNTCNIARTALGIFQKATLHGQGKTAYSLAFKNGGKSLEISKFAAPKGENLSILTQYSTKDNTERWNKFYKGFYNELAKIIQAESFEGADNTSLETACNLDNLEGFFRNLDYQNRRRAASQVDSATK